MLLGTLHASLMPFIPTDPSPHGEVGKRVAPKASLLSLPPTHGSNEEDILKASGKARS